MPRATNKDLNISEFENRKLFLQSKPRFLIMELTRNCNLQCTMCRNKHTYDPALDMSFELFTHIASELFPYADIVDLRGWGESTIMRDFIKYVEFTLKYDCRIRLYSNLTKTDDYLWRTLAKANCILGISFDAGTKDTFESIRRGARFETVIANINKLIEFARLYNGHTDDICLSTVVQEYNLNELHLIVQWAHRLGIRLVKMFPIICSWDNHNHLRHYPDAIKQALARASELADALGVRLEIGASLHDSQVLPEKVIPTCIHPWMYCYITSEGKVGFCDHLGAFPKYSLGDLQKESFAEIWNNELFQRLRAEHVAKAQKQAFISDRFSICNWCYAYRYDDTEHLVYSPYRKNIVTVTDILTQEYTGRKRQNQSNESLWRTWTNASGY